MFTKPKGNDAKNDKQGTYSIQGENQCSGAPKPVTIAESAPKPQAAPSILSTDLHLQRTIPPHGPVPL